MDTRKKIFFIKASPNGLPMLRSDEEFNKIRQIVERTNLKLSYQIQIILRTTPESVVDVFTEEKPWMIHYSGHSDDDQGEWIIGDQKPFVIDNDDLFALIEDRGHTVKFLFLNSCHSKEMADKFKYIVDFIICFDGKLSDKPAIQFAEKFYSNWSRQATIVEAFNLSMKQTAFLREKYFNPIFYSKINLIMKDLNFLMGNLTDLESAKIELKKQYAISNAGNFGEVLVNKKQNC